MAITKLLSITVFIWVQQYLLKRISPDEYAIYAIISSLVFLLPFITSALVSAGVRYMIHEYTQREFERMNRILSTSVILNAIIGFLIMVVSLIAVYYLDNLLTIESEYLLDAKLMFLIIIGTFLINFVLTPLGLGLHITQKLVIKNIIDLSVEVLKITLLFLLLFGVSTKALWLVVANSVALLLALIIRIILSKKIIPEMQFLISGYDKTFVMKFLSFGSWNSIILLSRYLRNFAALFLLNRFGNSTDVASFNIGRFVSRQTLQVWEPIRASIGTPLIAMYSKHQFQRLNDTYLKGSRLAIWLTSFVVFPAIIFSEAFIKLYVGDVYINAAYIIMALLSIIPFQMLNAMLPQISAAMDNQKDLAIRMMMIQIVNLAVMYYILVVMELTVVEMAWSIALVNIVGELFVITVFAKKNLKITYTNIFNKGLLPGLIPGLLASVYWYFIQYTFEVTSYVHLTLLILPGIIMLVLGIYIFGLEQDKKQMLDVIKIIQSKLKN
ncbi:MAG: lipopolysaccharide biosynthesis protein [Winogradskyella sp.]|uniref:lipopolysaccharide biosynthesis protein n=1 Tax=Winogradskyella sp. TaxID=1883156 RepID=UPI003859821C